MSSTKQVKFRDLRKGEIHGGILLENGDVICGCCGGIVPRDEAEICEAYKDWIGLDEEICGDDKATKPGEVGEITTWMIRKGIEQGLIRFIKDPNLGHGTVCQIGEKDDSGKFPKNNWFYFGGLTAEEEDPEEFLQHVNQEEMIQDIYSAMTGFYESDETFDEYQFYYSYVTENIK